MLVVCHRWNSRVPPHAQSSEGRGRGLGESRECWLSGWRVPPCQRLGEHMHTRFEVSIANDGIFGIAGDEELSYPLPDKWGLALYFGLV